MKTLILLRHGKAEVHNFTKKDIERSLTDRGKKNASDIGKYILDESGTPDLIISSSAKRTAETAELVASSLSYSEEDITTDFDLYLASPDEMLNFIKSLPNSVNKCILVGHNPGITYLINNLGVKIDDLPTASAVCFTFEVFDWKNISAQNANFVWIKLAREL